MHLFTMDVSHLHEKYRPITGEHLQLLQETLQTYHTESRVSCFDVTELYAPDGEAIPATPHPSMIYWCRVPFEVHTGDIMRAASGKGLEVRAKDKLKGDC